MSRARALDGPRVTRWAPLVPAWRSATIGLLWGPLGAVLAAWLLAVLPLWNPVWYQDDQLPTLFRTFHTDLAHHWGILYPRLAPELGFGYGRLLHEFYPPFGVELAAWLHTLGLGYVSAARATFSLCLLASALGMYAYARGVLGGPWLGVLAAVAFVWAPYVLLDAHKGGVLGESIALGIMPWAMLSVHRLLTRGGWRWFSATAGTLALAVLGHNITALFLVALASGYAGLLALRHWRDSSSLPDAARRLGIAAGGVLLALALSAIYWLPALLELPFSRVSDQRTGVFTVTRNLVAPLELLQPAVIFDYYVEAVPRFGLASALLIGAGLALFVLAIRRRALQPGPDRLVVLACGVCILIVLLLQLRAAALIWQTVPLISFVQFPQRLFVFGAFAGAIVLGAVPWSVGALLGGDRRQESGAGEPSPPPPLPQGERGDPRNPASIPLSPKIAKSQPGPPSPASGERGNPAKALPSPLEGEGAGVRGTSPLPAVGVRAAPRETRNLKPETGAIAGLVVALLLALTSLPGIYWTWPVSDSHLIDEADVGIGTAGDRRLSERRAFDDYFPAWVEEDASQIPRPAPPNRTERYRAASAGPTPSLELVERGYDRTVLRARAEEPATVVIHQFYFPGWQATADGAPLDVGPAGPLGLVQVTVPPGQHLVRVWFGETPLRVGAALLSDAALLVLLGALVLGLGLRRTALGVAGLLLVVLVPRLLHDSLGHDLDARPAPRGVTAQVTPWARVLALELDAAPASAGTLVPVTLVWQSVEYTPRDLQTGVRLLSADGSRVISERWGRPNRERTPTNKWIVGEVLSDVHLLRLPPDLRPGSYRLEAGIRDPDSRDRVPLGLAPLGELLVR